MLNENVAGMKTAFPAPSMSFGELYEHGRGVAQDYDKAREWFEKAAATGDADAKAWLGR